MIKWVGHIALLIAILSSCSGKTESSNTDVWVAKVYNNYLLEDDVLSQIPFDASVADSVSIRNSIVNSWINRQLLVHQAELNLPIEEQDVSQKLEKYRTDLLIFSYQNKLLTEKLETNVSRIEIEDYYNQNSDKFSLVDYIVKAYYIKLDSSDTKHKKVKKWLMSNDEEDKEKLFEYCNLHSSNFSLEEKWMYLYELLEEVPIVSYNKEKLLKNKKLIAFFDKGNLYLVRLVDYKLKDGISPLSLEEENIKRIILNNRKLDFLENLKTDIYQKAKNTQEIEIFVP